MEVVELQAGTYLPKNAISMWEKNGVKAVAVVETGVHILVFVSITRTAISVGRGSDSDLLLLWTYYYLNHISCIVGSIFLYNSVSKMNINRIQKFMKYAPMFYIIWVIVILVEFSALEIPNEFAVAVTIVLIVYKLLSLLIVYAFLKRWKKFSTLNSQLSETGMRALENGCENQRQDFLGNIFDSLPHNKANEIPFDSLSLTSVLLGEGSFGQVFRGTLRTDSAEGHLTVAVKTIESNADDCYFRSLLAELKILSSVGKHDHIVGLIGACTGELKQRKLYIVVEFCVHGSIDKYIQAKKGFFRDMIVDDQIIVTNTVCNASYTQLQETVTTLDILKWAYQTSCGMEYLANKNIIHGDIATRNILLTESMSIKIADFGLSRHLYDQLNYIKKQQDPLPWRWMALESFCSREFSTKTDVWSYAVTLWEFFTLCEIPFPEFNWSVEFVDMIKSGYRLQRPALCTSGIYELMCSCWQLDPHCRPRFCDISEYFAKIINAVQDESSKS